MEIFRLQAEGNPVYPVEQKTKSHGVYKKYIEQLGATPEKIKSILHIPFLPIEFFKTHEVITKSQVTNHKSQVFLSSGTTGTERSKHYVSDISLYEKSFRKSFELFYGDVKQYAILALLPGYYENRNSSLIYMMQDLIRQSKNKYSTFYNQKDETLLQVLQTLLQKKQKVILFGVSFALLDFPSLPSPQPSPNGRGRKGEDWLFVVETGGMKGRRPARHQSGSMLTGGEEITREELHKILCEKFGVQKIHSEYGMTELLSQAYSTGDGIFNCPPWMKVFVRDVNDPFQIFPHGKTGALNIIDLANIHSCSFIATQDVGRIHKDGSFEVLGRMDNSDLRGCNLLMA
ncbi:MAG: acyl transferase [Bacteroidetes bacterium]|nr:acyl transferase [Bacteroidota bacterium]